VECASAAGPAALRHRRVTGLFRLSFLGPGSSAPALPAHWRMGARQPRPRRQGSSVRARHRTVNAGATRGQAGIVPRPGQGGTRASARRATVGKVQLSLLERPRQWHTLPSARAWTCLAAVVTAVVEPAGEPAPEAVATVRVQVRRRSRRSQAHRSRDRPYRDDSPRRRPRTGERPRADQGQRRRPADEPWQGLQRQPPGNRGARGTAGVSWLGADAVRQAALDPAPFPSGRRRALAHAVPHQVRRCHGRCVWNALR
jgi:hypothetical protein